MWEAIQREHGAALAALAKGQALVVKSDARRGELVAGSTLPDPGPGHWDRSADLRTERVEPRRTAVVGGRVYEVRSHATGLCPGGPCGEAVVLVATGRLVEHTQHSMERCDERGIPADVAIAVVEQGVARGPTKHVMLVGERLVTVESPDGRIATVY